MAPVNPPIPRVTGSSTSSAVRPCGRHSGSSTSPRDPSHGGPGRRRKSAVSVVLSRGAALLHARVSAQPVTILSDHFRPRRHLSGRVVGAPRRGGGQRRWTAVVGCLGHGPSMCSLGTEIGPCGYASLTVLCQVGRCGWRRRGGARCVRGGCCGQPAVLVGRAVMALVERQPWQGGPGCPARRVADAVVGNEGGAVLLLLSRWRARSSRPRAVRAACSETSGSSCRRCGLRRTRWRRLSCPSAGGAHVVAVRADAGGR